MKLLVLAVLSVLVLAHKSLRAQMISPTEGGKTIEDLKKKYANGGQKPVLKQASATETAPIAEGGGITIADFEALLLKSPECKKNLADTAQLAGNLKGEYGLISCLSEIEGVRQIVLVPKSVSPNQQLMYGSVSGFKLLRARLVDHYLVLQFDRQVQYLDMLKQDKDLYGKDIGFALSGFVADETVNRFEDMGIFIDALKTCAGVQDEELLSKVPALTAKIVNGKRFRMNASKIKGSWTVTVTSNGGEISQVWPEKKQP